MFAVLFGASACKCKLQFRAERNVNRLLFNFFRQKPITCLQLLTGIAKEEKKRKKAVTNLTNQVE